LPALIASFFLLSHLLLDLFTGTGVPLDSFQLSLLTGFVIAG
jgi:hypothetical protein